MTREIYELHRTDSLCPNPQSRLFDLVKNNRNKELRKLVEEHGKELLEQIYDHPYYKTIVQIVCSNLASQVTSETFQTLIDLGADLFFPNEQFDNKQCLHFAVESGNREILTVILKNLKEDQVNSSSDGGNTALHCLVKFCERDDHIQAECVRLLLTKKEFKVNATDDKNLTGIFHAARKGKREVVNAILKYSQDAVDIDSHKLRGKSARDLIEDKHLMDDSLPQPDDSRRRNNNINSFDVLVSYLLDLKEDEFLRSGHLSQTTANEDNSNSTLLQLATSKGLLKAVEKLIELGADVSKTTERNGETPIEIAASEGYHEILKILLEKSSNVPPKALAEVLKMADFDSIDPKRDYQICCKLLLEQPIDIEESLENDFLLHYAVRYGGPEVTLTLLRAGASLARKNRHGIMPVEDIDSITMEKHLDECLEANLEKSIETENYEAAFNYRTLMPPSKYNKICKSESKQVDSSSDDIEAASTFLKQELAEFTSETDLVNFMSDSPELKHLLKHPVITSFIYMKWLRLSRFFYINFAFYVTFCVALLLYVFINYNVGESENFVPNTILTVLLSVLFTILALREVLQMILSPKTYFLSFENWIELVLVFSTGLILFQKSPTESIRKQASALVILLAAFEIVLLVGQHPKMTTNIVMLRTVSYNFFKFFMWYAILIIAFALSFHVLFKSDENNQRNTNSSNNKEESEPDFFTNPGVSLFKTFVMLTGEFDASSIDFQQFPITSHIIFALFIFMIAIILFNLLNGLAVSDTQMIKSNAELVGHIARIQHITYIENMLLGNILPDYLLQFFKQKCSCFRAKQSKFTLLRPFAQKVCLFPHYIKDYKLKVFPNRFGRVLLSNERLSCDDSEDAGCINDCKYVYLDRKTAKRTRNLIRERKINLERERTEVETERNRKEIIEEQCKQMEDIKNEQTVIMHKLDMLLNNFNCR